jgi:hypothetical protein
VCLKAQSIDPEMGVSHNIRVRFRPVGNPDCISRSG